MLFEESTGYTFDKTCHRTSVTYVDASLQATADDLLLLPRITGSQEVVGPVVGQEDNPDFPRILDIRYSIACLLFSALNGGNPSLQRSCTPDEFIQLTGRIARAIPSSRRWIVLPPIRENAEMLTRYYQADFKPITDREFRYLNVLEDENIGWIATFGVDEHLQARAIFNEAFEPFAHSLGLSSFAQYILPLHLDPSYFDDPVTPRSRVVGPPFVKDYANRMNLSPNRLVFTPARIRTLRLEDLSTSFIPIFAQILPGDELEDGLFIVDEAMIEVNNPARLCYGLPAPRKMILQGIEKGKAFETFVHRLLTGAERVLVLHSGGNQPFPDGFARLKKPDAEIEKESVVRYNYVPPAGGSGFRVAIGGPKGSPLSELAKSTGKPRTELDLLLVHDGEPRHILVGECKFTTEYKGGYFREGRGFVERAAKAIRGSLEIRKSLGLPEELPVVATLIVSHSGRGMAVPRPSLMIPMTHLLSGQFLRTIRHWLASPEALE